MVTLGRFYHIDAEDISVVKIEKGKNDAYPYELNVLLKSGQNVGLGFKTEDDRDKERRRLVEQIEQERRWDTLSILDRLKYLEYTLDLLNKRQLRIWRILSRLLPVKPDIDKEG